MDKLQKLKDLVENKKDREFYINCFEDGVSLEAITELNKKQKVYKNLFKQENIKPSNYSNQTISYKEDFNLLEFTVDSAIEKSAAKKKMRSFFSKKNAHLMTTNIERKFIELNRLNVSEEFYEYFRKKVSAFHSEESMSNALSKEIKTIKTWDFNYQRGRLNNYDVEILKDSDNEIVFEVFDHETAKSLGTDMWCICRENEDFIKYRDKTDRVIFKYDLNEDPLLSNHNMTAYITKASGELINGYMKDDEVMNDEQELSYKPNVTSLDSETYLDRLNNSNEPYHNYPLKVFMDGMADIVKKSDFNFKISPETMSNYLNENKVSVDVVDKFIDNYKNLFVKKDWTNGMVKIMNGMNKLNSETNKTFRKILKNNAYQQSEEFKSLRLIETIEENTLFIDHDSVDLLIKVKNYDLTKEIAEYLEKNDILSENTLLEPFYKKQGVNLSDYFKSNGKEDILRNVLKNNFRLANDLFGGSNNPSGILEVFKGYEDKCDSLFLDRLKDYAEKNKIEPLSAEVSNETLKNEVLRHPKKVFIKQKKIEDRNIHFNYEESLTLLKKAFLGEDIPFAHYEKDYAIEDFVTTKMNMKSRDFLFNSKNISSKAREDFFDFLDECKPEASNSLQCLYEEEKPKKKIINKNKIR